MDDNAALTKMIRVRKMVVMDIGFDERRAVLKAIESIRDATGIDITERPGIELPELKGRTGFAIPSGLFRNSQAE